MRIVSLPTVPLLFGMLREVGLKGISHLILPAFTVFVNRLTACAHPCASNWSRGVET